LPTGQDTLYQPSDFRGRSHFSTWQFGYWWFWGYYHSSFLLSSNYHWSLPCWPAQSGSLCYLWLPSRITTCGVVGRWRLSFLGIVTTLATSFDA